VRCKYTIIVLISIIRYSAACKLHLFSISNAICNLDTIYSTTADRIILSTASRDVPQVTEHSGGSATREGGDCEDYITQPGKSQTCASRPRCLQSDGHWLRSQRDIDSVPVYGDHWTHCSG